MLKHHVHGPPVGRYTVHGLTANADLARKLEEIEKKYDGQFRIVFDAIRQLMSPTTQPARPLKELLLTLISILPGLLQYYIPSRKRRHLPAAHYPSKGPVVSRRSSGAATGTN